MNKLELVRKANLLLKDSMESCGICPRRCRVNRAAGKRGYCRAPDNPVVYSYNLHHGEEPPISGTKGSGTVFFSYCNMKCVYCQNYYFSQLDQGKETSVEGLAAMFLSLQKKGCHNINLVNPTHFVPQILKALEYALVGGLSVPIIYNTSGYDLPETLDILDGIVDIYLPDMRYSNNEMAKKYSDANDYVDYNRKAVKEMNRQVGDLVLDPSGVALRGLIIRLLAIPADISGTVDSLRFIKDHISQNASLSIMSQYYPTFKAYEYSDISAGVTVAEYKNIVDEASILGLNNGWIQETPGKSDTGFFGTNIKPV